MNKYDVLREKKKSNFDGLGQELNNLNKIAIESKRVAGISKNVNIIIQDIDKQFAQATQFNKVDISFLLFATALQCARQYLLTPFKERTCHKESEKEVKKDEKEFFNERYAKRESGEKYKWYHSPMEDIILRGVPYDIISGSKQYNLKLSGKNHRFKTLGHDPLLGWIFGTSNIMTSTLTDWQFDTYHVQRINNMPKLNKRGNTSLMLERVMERSKGDPKVLAACVAKQYFHYKSDEFSKMGLPVPVVSTLSPEYAQNLANKGIDKANLETIGKQMTFSVFINTLISIIHQFFYDENEDGSHSLYEVKTRKILSYSNLLASSSNIIYVAFTKDTKRLDLGGLVVTLYRLINDYKFIKNVKQEFLEKEFYNVVMGSDYDF